MRPCGICGGSGVLNVESSTYGVIWEPKASWCHACDIGRVWKEIGLDPAEF